MATRRGRFLACYMQRALHRFHLVGHICCLMKNISILGVAMGRLCMRIPVAAFPNPTCVISKSINQVNMNIKHTTTLSMRACYINFELSSEHSRTHKFFPKPESHIPRNLSNDHRCYIFMIHHFPNCVHVFMDFCKNTKARNSMNPF